MVNTTGMGFMSSMSKMVIRLSFSEWTNVELKAWPDLSAIQVAVFHVAFGIEDQAYIGTETKVRIHFGEEGGHGCLGSHGS
jgi:hypothetical protein